MFDPETGRMYSKEIRQLIREWEIDQGDTEKLDLALGILTKLKDKVNGQIHDPRQLRLFE